MFFSSIFKRYSGLETA